VEIYVDQQMVRRTGLGAQSYLDPEAKASEKRGKRERARFFPGASVKKLRASHITFLLNAMMLQFAILTTGVVVSNVSRRL